MATPRALMDPNAFFENIESFEKVSLYSPMDDQNTNGREITYVKKKDEGSEQKTLSNNAIN